MVLFARFWSSEGLEWTYRDMSAWKDVGDAEANKCDLEGSQSPIDITIDATTSAPSQYPALTIKYGESWDGTCGSTVKQFTNEHTWVVEFPNGAGACSRNETNPDYPHVVWMGKNYFLYQFHYRAPSEHTFDGIYTDMEAHHVHKAADGQALIIAVNLKVGEENAFLKQYWGTFPLKPKAESDDSTVKAASEVPAWTTRLPYETFFPESKSYFHYMGSFTTPPCTPNTAWILLRDTVTMSEAQLVAYRSALDALPQAKNQLAHPNVAPAGVNPKWNAQFGTNNRTIQPLGNRKVFLYEEGWALAYTIAIFAVLGIALISCGVVCALMASSGNNDGPKNDDEATELTADISDEDIVE